ncbi:MAG TPA: chromosomal replication initiator protein DnaA, partial [Rhodospirillales bacterium]|nr:chromosomal replication initiator protein DnaA [Rhodospirillales bacterium]
MVDDRQLQTQWYRVCSRLRAEIGDSAFENWITPIKVFGFDGSEVNLGVPSRFMRDWVLANYLDRLNELWNGENSSVQSIALSIQ